MGYTRTAVALLKEASSLPPGAEKGDKEDELKRYVATHFRDEGILERAGKNIVDKDIHNTFKGADREGPNAFAKLKTLSALREMPTLKPMIVELGRIIGDNKLAEAIIGYEALATEYRKKSIEEERTGAQNRGDHTVDRGLDAINRLS